MVNGAALPNKIRLRQLRCFVAVARKKSFVLAAEDLGLTQPAVSRSVRELESLLGHDLFDRSTRGAELTDRGRTFLQAAEAGLLKIAQGAQAVTGHIGTGETVRIGALPNVCSQYLPSLVKDFKAAYPEVLMTIRPGTNVDLMDSLRRGETDFVIGRLSTSDDMRGLVFEALFDEPLVFVVRAEHPIATRPTLQDALSYPLLLPPTGTIIRDEVDRFLAGQGVTSLPDVTESISSDFLRDYLQMTDCVAATPRGVVRSDLARGAVRQLRLGNDGLRGPVGLTTNPDMRAGNAVSNFIQRIRDTH